MEGLALCDLKKRNYREIWDLQENLRRQMIEGQREDGVVLVVEHYPVYTFGRAEKGENFLASTTWLKENEGIDVEAVNRGGKVTYHGPGQLVVYPVVNLRKLKTSVKCFVHDLEAIMIGLANALNVEAARQVGSPGVYVSGRKLGSVGIHIRKNVSIHGLALNVCPNMTHFSYITPCGMTGVEMTSISKETGQATTVEEVKALLRSDLEKCWDVRLYEMEERQLS